MPADAPSLPQRLRAWARRIKHDAVALWFALRDPATPWLARALAFLVVAYALSPIDLVPDFIPVLGYLDDVLLLPALIWLAVRLVPPAVMAACRERAQAWLEGRGGRKPRLWMGLVLVALVWGGIAAGVAAWVLGR